LAQDGYFKVLNHQKNSKIKEDKDEDRFLGVSIKILVVENIEFCPNGACQMAPRRSA
jgi:hypothetical protein